jgi:hypothetical protein
MGFRAVCAIGLFWLSLAAWPSAVRGDVIGGFDASRGGIVSLEFGTDLTMLRSLLAADFPGSTLSATPTLTSAYLSTVRALYICSATGDHSATTALSAAEQTALNNYVLAGGGVVINTDNDTFDGAAPAVNNSFLTPFGLHTTGTLNGVQATTVTNTTSPVTNGPFGHVGSYPTSFPGWFDNLGANATQLAILNANGQPSLAVIPRGALGAGSGAVVFVSDTGPFLDAFINTPDSRALDGNIFAYALGTSAIPEPSVTVLAALGGLIALAYMAFRRRRAAA